AAIENFAKFVDFGPADNAFRDWIKDAGLTLRLDRFAPVGNDEVGAAHGFIIVFASALCEPATFDQPTVRADTSDDVLSRLEPGPVEYRHIGIRRADHYIGAGDGLARRVHWHKFGIHEARHALAEFPAVVGIAAEYPVSLNRTLVL